MGDWLVTGGAGFIGSHIAGALLERGARVRILDDFSTGRQENLAAFKGRLAVIKGDLNDPAALRRAVRGAEVVFHEAALPSVPRSVADPVASNRANIDGTVALLWAAKEQAFGASSTPRPRRRTATRRLSRASRRCSRSRSRPTPSASSPASTIFTPSGVATASRPCRCVTSTSSARGRIPKSQYAAAIPLFTTAILEDRPPVVYGDGEQSRDFTYVENVVHANLLAAEAPEAPGKVFNVGCGLSVTVNHVIAAINRILGKDVRPKFEPRRAGDVMHSLADISAAKKCLGYEPKVSFEDGLLRTVEFFKSARRRGQGD